MGKKKSFLKIISSAIVLLTGCNKFVEVDPPTTSIASATVYSSNASAAAVLTSIYTNMSINYYANLSGGLAGISLLMGLSADELTSYTTDPMESQFYLNALSSHSGTTSNYYFWTEIYNELHVANAAIEGVEGSSGITPAEKKQLVGEAKFMRAFLLFYATNLYGEVPLVTSTNYSANNSLTRSSVSLVMAQVISDLQDAAIKLPVNYFDALGNTSNERIRPNQGAATALLARAYLYNGNWKEADSAASAVINNSTLYEVVSLDSPFLKNNQEAIWQLQSLTGYTGYDAPDGGVFVLTSPPGSGFPVALSSTLLNSFEQGDARRTEWVGAFTEDSINYYYYPNKYKIGNYDPSRDPLEYTVVLRLGEQYLIRAEAKARQNDLAPAINDLNVIRHRAQLGDYAGTIDQISVLNSILHEKQIELFTEWGHRWFDLKRTENINSVMDTITPLKGGGAWSPDKALLPIPFDEIRINSNLTQNPGY